MCYSPAEDVIKTLKTNRPKNAYVWMLAHMSLIITILFLPQVRTMVTRPYTHRTNVSGVTCMTQQLVLTVPGQTALQSLVTTKINAPNRTLVMPAGMYSIRK